MVRNGTKNVQKMFFVIFGVFEFFVNFRFFSKNDVFRFFAHDYSLMIEKSFKSPRNTAYFVPNFLTEFFLEVDLGPSGATYAQMSQNCLKIVRNGLARDSNFSRLGG